MLMIAYFYYVSWVIDTGPKNKYILDSTLSIIEKQNTSVCKVGCTKEQAIIFILSSFKANNFQSLFSHQVALPQRNVMS